MLKEIVVQGLIGYSHLHQKDTFPLFFIHGLWEGAWIFQDWAEYVATAGFECVAINLRGHSDINHLPNIGKVSISDYVTDVKTVLKRIGPAILIGHSAGGLVGQIVASQEKELVKGLVLVNAVPPRGIFLKGEPLFKIWKMQYLKPMMLNKGVKINLSDASYLMLNKISDPDQLYQRLVVDSGKVLRQVLCQTASVKEISCPVLVVAAKEDRMVVSSVQQKLSQKYKAQYQEVPGGHMVMIESGWKDVIQKITTFVSLCH